VEIVGFRGLKSKKRHGGPVLHKYGRVRTKEREDERGQKLTRGHHATWHGRATCVFGAVRSVAARVCLDVQILLAARVCL